MTTKFSRNSVLFLSGTTISVLCFTALLMKYGIGVAITPVNALYLLAVAPFWMYARCEYSRRKHSENEASRNAALLLLSILLAFYAVPQLLQYAMFPAYIPTFAHYFVHAPVGLLAGLLLIRLHAFGAGATPVFIGVMTSVSALFFLTARIALFFLKATPAPTFGQFFVFLTYVAIGLSYALMFGATRTRIVKNTLTLWGGLDEELWSALRRELFTLLLAGTHLLFFLSLGNSGAQTILGLLFLPLAGLWIYAGVFFRHALFLSAAYAEIVAALYCDKYGAAFQPESWTIWLLLAFFALLIPLYSRVLRTYRYAAENFYSWLIISAALVGCEYFIVLRFFTFLGILPLLLLWLLTLFVPIPSTARENPAFQFFLGIFPYVPALLFFLQQGPPSLTHLPRALLATALTSLLIVGYRFYEWEWFAGAVTRDRRVIHYLHDYLRRAYSLLPIFGFVTSGVLAAHGLSLRHGPALFAAQLSSMLIVQGILAGYWFHRARQKRQWWWTVTAEAMISGMIFSLRQAAPLLFHFSWTIHWDLTIGLMAAFVMTACRPFLKGQDKSIRLPIRFTLFGLPLITILYALDYQVGFDVLSRVILLYSMLFIWQAYNERDRYVLAYAFTGINSFLILLFMHNDIQSLQAYITPVCISLLILVQVFRDITGRSTANLVRGVTLAILLGTAMFQAFVENAASPLAHLILISLSILSVLAAIVLHIRIFVAAGVFAFVLDMIAILYLVLSGQDTETLKVILGIGFTAGGGLILSGYIFYRKHHERFENLFKRFKRIIASWE